MPPFWSHNKKGMINVEVFRQQCQWAQERQSDYANNLIFFLKVELKIITGP